MAAAAAGGDVCRRLGFYNAVTHRLSLLLMVELTELPI